MFEQYKQVRENKEREEEKVYEQHEQDVVAKNLLTMMQTQGDSTIAAIWSSEDFYKRPHTIEEEDEFSRE